MKKNAFVTGAASGIGKATAKQLLAQGWRVGIADIDEQALEQVKTELGEQDCEFFVLDVTSPEQWHEALTQFTKDNERLDVLVNNAGIVASGSFEDTSLQKQLSVADVNFKGVLIGCHAAFPYLKASPKACVVNMSSASAIYGQPALAAYSASKFAVSGLTESLSLEWEKYGIRVVDIIPLFVNTNMVVDLDAKAMNHFGVTLSADDVAKTIFKAINSNRNKVHWPVGFHAKTSYFMSTFSPDWLVRLVNKKLGT